MSRVELPEEMIDYSSLYQIMGGGMRGAYHLQPVSSVNSDYYNILKGTVKPPEPFVYAVESGRKCADILTTTLCVLEAFSHRFITLLREHNLSGWDSYPIVLVDKKGNEIGGYYGLIILGQCGEVDKSREEVYIRPRPVPAGKEARMARGMYFKDDFWDGSDLFSPPGYFGLFISKRARDVIVSEKLSNCNIKTLSSIERMKMSSEP